MRYLHKLLDRGEKTKHKCSNRRNFCSGGAVWAMMSPQQFSLPRTVQFSLPRILHEVSLRDSPLSRKRNDTPEVVTATHVKLAPASMVCCISASPRQKFSPIQGYNGATHVIVCTTKWSRLAEWRRSRLIAAESIFDLASTAESISTLK